MKDTWVNQKFWRLFKSPTISLAYMAIYAASCVEDDGCVSFDGDVLSDTLKVSHQEIQDAMELLPRLAVVYPYGADKFFVNPYYIWRGEIASHEHLSRCNQWDDLVKKNSYNIKFCKKYPKSIVQSNFMNVSEVLEILALSIVTNNSVFQEML